MEFLILIVVAIVASIVYSNSKKKKFANSPEVQSEMLQLEEFLSFIKDARTDYFRYSYKEDLKKSYNDLYKKFISQSYRTASNNSIVTEFKRIYSGLDDWIGNSFLDKITPNKKLLLLQFLSC